MLFQHYTRRTIPPQLAELYGDAAGREEQKEEQGEEAQEYNQCMCLFMFRALDEF